MPEQLLRAAGLSCGAALLYGQLARYAGEDGLCFPSVNRLALDLGVHRRTVERRIAELTSWRLIVRHRRGGGRWVNEYTFHWHPILDPPQLPLDFDPEPSPIVPCEKPVEKLSMGEMTHDKNVASEAGLSLSEREKVCGRKSSSSEPACGKRARIIPFPVRDTLSDPGPSEPDSDGTEAEAENPSNPGAPAGAIGLPDPEPSDYTLPAPKRTAGFLQRPGLTPIREAAEVIRRKYLDDSS